MLAPFPHSIRSNTFSGIDFLHSPSVERMTGGCKKNPNLSEAIGTPKELTIHVTLISLLDVTLPGTNCLDQQRREVSAEIKRLFMQI